MVLALSSSRDSCHVCPADHSGWTKEPAFHVKCATLIPATTPQQLRPDVTSSKQRSLRIQASTKFRTQDSGTLWRQATKWLLWCPKQMQQVAPQTKWYGPASDWDGIKGFNMVHDNNIVRKDTPSQSGSDVCKRPPWSVSKPAPKAHRIQNQHVNLPWFCLTRNNGMVRH